MIRILHMIGSLNIGGSQAMIMNLYRNIDREKIQFDFILDHPDQKYYVEEVKSLGGKIYTLPGFKGTNILEVKNSWNKFFEKHKEYKVLHSHVRSYASVYLPIAKKHGLTTIIHSHSTSNGSGISSVVKKFMQFPLRYQADYFFGCSKEAGKWLFGEKVVTGSRYYMIQNAIDLTKYRPDETARKCYRDKIGADDSSIVLIHIGRFHEAKNHLFLLEVFAGYLAEHKNAILVLVGDGDLRAVIEKRIAELQLGNHVRLVGERNDVPDWLKAADCLLFPSKWEGLPVTVVEAQAAGLTCLVSDTVTKDVNVSVLVRNLPINQGIEPWLKVMQYVKTKKIDVSKEIIKAGFDIQSTAKWITSFYLKVAGNE